VQTSERARVTVDLWAHRFRGFSAHAQARMVWTALAAACVGFVLVISSSLGRGGWVQRLDEAILRYVAEHLRTPFLSAMMTDWSALGSLALMIAIGVVVVLLLVSIRDPAGAAHLVLTVAVSYFLSSYAKGWFSRPRPSIVPQLIHASGFSYPSGHSVSSAALYVTLAVLAARHVDTHRARITFFVLAGLVIALVSFSRVYLGVHYPSDTLGGALMGSAWALLVAAAFSRVYWGPSSRFRTR
jgi:undecaprenyl-diphosphatase